LQIGSQPVDGFGYPCGIRMYSLDGLMHLKRLFWAA
jgi:hypothetical protein